MTPDELRSLVRLRRPAFSQVTRTLSRCVTIADLQHAARRRWPQGVADYVDGGADAEISLRRNREAYERWVLTPSVLVDVDAVDTRTSLLGKDCALPFALAPTGYTRMMHADGELAVARAAAAADIPYTLSTMATTSLEDVARTVPGDLWFQLYVWRDRHLVTDLMERAHDNGYRVLMLTVDTAVTGLRTRDAHHGFTIPPQLSASTLVDMARHPWWWGRLVTGEPITFANIPGHDQDPSGAMELAAHQFDASVTWEDLDTVRQQWPGKLVVKGMTRPDDVARAARTGVDAVVLSNHGGRQLDQTISPLEALPAVRDAVGNDLEVLVDSGIRRGLDLAIALARGADGCLIGRPYLYGLGAGGQRGVTAAITMLDQELRRAMQLLGVTSIAALQQEGPQLVHDRGGSDRTGMGLDPEVSR